MSRPKPIPIGELKPGMIVYYKLDSADDGHKDSDYDWNFSETSNQAVVVMDNDSPMLFDLFHEGESSNGLFWRNPQSWTPYRTKQDADLACLREALARHSRHVSAISDEIKKLTNEARESP